MSHGVSGLTLRKVRGVLQVEAFGRTERGQKYRKGQIAIEAKGPKDPGFNDEVAAAVIALLAGPSVPSQ